MKKCTKNQKGINMMMVLQQFHTNIERLNKLNREK
jgi:hypothetical protein